MASGDLVRPDGVSFVRVSTWSPELHCSYSLTSRSCVKTALLLHNRWATESDSLRALYPLLLTEILPFALPAIDQPLRWGGSTATPAMVQMGIPSSNALGTRSNEG